MAAPFGGMPIRFDPQPDEPAARRALVLPGAGYSPAHPLLEFGRQALLQHGWSVRQLWWDAPVHHTDSQRQRWVCGQLSGGVAEELRLGRAEQWLVMAKSLGTRAVGCPFDASAYVLLTPLLGSDDVVSGVRRVVAAGTPVLLVGGTADPAWSGDVARDLGCDVLEVAGADHGMAVEGDTVRTAQVHVEVAEAVERFLTALDGPVAHGG